MVTFSLHVKAVVCVQSHARRPALTTCIADCTIQHCFQTRVADVWETHLRKTEARTRSSYKSTPDVTPHVTSFLKCRTAQKHKVTNTWHLPRHLFVSSIWSSWDRTPGFYVKKSTDHTPLTVRETGCCLFYRLGESTALLALEWLILRLGGTLLCPAFSSV